MVVNAARVSYAKHHDTFDDSDERLLRYLARNGHWSPFSHPQASFRISASIAVANQLKRHQVGLALNEVSRRYVTDAPTFDLPDVWRSAPSKGQSKQGSGEPVEDALQKVCSLMLPLQAIHIAKVRNDIVLMPHLPAVSPRSKPA